MLTLCVLLFKSSHCLPAPAVLCPNGRLTFCLLFAGRRCLCPQWHSDLLIVHHQWEHSFQCACSKIFHAPMVDSRVARFLQGGGVAVTWAGNAGGSVSIVNSQIYSNTASNVRVRVQNFPHRPDGKISDALASTFACTTAADAPINYSRYMCRRNLQFSHRPDGRLTFCSLFAGRRCSRLGWLSDHLIVHHQWEYSWLCARAHALKSSHRPDGKVADGLATTRACTTAAYALVNYSLYMP